MSRHVGLAVEHRLVGIESKREEHGYGIKGQLPQKLGVAHRVEGLGVRNEAEGPVTAPGKVEGWADHPQVVAARRVPVGLMPERAIVMATPPDCDRELAFAGAR